MITRPKDLPSFAQPPVTEVVLSVQFEELHRLQMVDARSIWEQFGVAEFPIVQEHPPLPPTFETFGVPAMQAMPRFELLTAGVWPRFWFLKADQTELIQFQRDRLVHNWRKLDPARDYPRYEPLRADFERELVALQGFLHAHESELKANQVEIAYVNTIPCPNGDAEPFARIFRHWNRIGSAHVEPTEAASFVTHHVIVDAMGAPTARLFIEAAQGRSLDNSPAVRLSLTVRGAPKTSDFADLFKFLDDGRNKIVKGFADITTPEMHELWGVEKP